MLLVRFPQSFIPLNLAVLLAVIPQHFIERENSSVSVFVYRLTAGVPPLLNECGPLIMMILDNKYGFMTYRRQPYPFLAIIVNINLTALNISVKYNMYV